MPLWSYREATVSAVRKQRCQTVARHLRIAKRWAALADTHISGRMTNINMVTPKNQGKPWTPADNRLLQQLAKGNTPTRVAGIKLQRTPGAVQQQAGKLGVSLEPHNRSPYGTQKKH